MLVLFWLAKDRGSFVFVAIVDEFSAGCVTLGCRGVELAEGDGADVVHQAALVVYGNLELPLDLLLPLNDLALREVTGSMNGQVECT